jgi:hypothetical protein
MSAPPDITAQLAHHDAAISGLSGRMTGVEQGLKTLQGEVHHGFLSLGSKLDKIDAAPKFDFHKTVSTVLKLALLFSMVVGGIIWVTTNQFSGVVATQKATNDSLIAKIERHEGMLEKIAERVGWAPRIERGARP